MCTVECPRYCRFIQCEMWNATQLSNSVLCKVKCRLMVYFIVCGGMPRNPRVLHCERWNAITLEFFSVHGGMPKIL